MSAIVSETVRTCPQFYDIDPMGVVWHGNYARFFELARAALLTKIGYGYQEMMDSGYLWPVVDMHIRYYRPMRLGQWIDVTASIVEWECRLKLVFLARDAETGAKLSKASSVQVAVDRKTNEMLWQTPPILMEKLAPYL